MRWPLNRTAAPLALVALVTLSISGCSTSSSIRSDSSPSFAAVEAALAQTGIEFCNLRFSSAGSYCDHYPGQPPVATVSADTPASFFGDAISIAEVPDNSVWANGRTIVSLRSPSQMVVTALKQNGFKWLTTGRVKFTPGTSGR